MFVVPVLPPSFILRRNRKKSKSFQLFKEAQRVLIPCAHSHTRDLKCIDCGAPVPATDPLAKAVAEAKPDAEVKP